MRGYFWRRKFKINFMNKRIIISMIAFSFIVFSCKTIRPGNVGVKQRFGKLSENTKSQGLMFYNPFVSKVILVPTRTINRELSMNLPSKEGLTIASDVSILYRIQPTKVTDVIREIGLNYDLIITSVFRSAAADICSQFFAKDMHSGERRVIESQIAALMNERLGPKGFIIEAVLLKSITLPKGLTQAIEQKLEAEQDAMRMQFILEQQRREAERQVIAAEAKRQVAVIDAQARAEVIRIEAEAQQKANELLNSSLTPGVLKLKQIEAMLALATSPNTKTVFMDPKNPFMNMMEPLK
jgi:regulator of protease activity HflC (stomatin/prohibitin superfamily)